ncbi:MAG TPA: hypothetical protein VK498_02335 [Ferruginibacter sp.]|nr:hypothetical protein [Ferruginibacter sp.]
MKKTKPIEYNDIILSCFPKELKNDVEVVLDILPFSEQNIKLHDGQTHLVENLIHPDKLKIQLNGESLAIPYRVYFNEPEIAKENKLSPTQKTILNCIYLRHHDGYLRQRRLELIIGESEYWIMPFTLQLLGEYVYDILELLDKHIDTTNILNYRNFIKENAKFWQQTESRMISYWNVYYRSKSSTLNAYLGRQIANKIKKTDA